ncbi:hypothetical protein C8J57DRAFT_1352336 [Mycena rebaudengoi]|nr:hypothetical protein C8J57DRAFT_1352336 [Mycena rebaudengoi]
MASPLHLQELLDHCIGFLHNSTADLTAAALVARTWVSPAQSHLYYEVVRYRREIRYKHENTWSQLLRTLHTSPHLIRHIRRLCVRPPPQLTSETFSKISLLPFSHLEDVKILSCALVPPSAVAIQQLLSMPTLRHVSLFWEFDDPATFLQVWDRCSRSIRSISLDSSQGLRQARDPFNPVVRQSAAPITLEFFRVGYINGIVPDWLQHETCPFDFSGLKVLAVYRYPEMLDWPRFAPASQSVEALAIEIPRGQISIDLSGFPKLTFLRITLRDVPLDQLLDAFLTVSPFNHLRKLVICVEFEFEGDYTALDSVLSQLLVDVEFQCIIPKYYPDLAKHFPQSSARNILRQTAYDPYWFEHHITSVYSPDVYPLWSAER